MADPAAPSPADYDDRRTFRYGFLLLEKPHSCDAAVPPAGWRRHEIGAFDLWTHPETKVQFLRSSDRDLCLLGDVFDMETGEVPQEAPVGDAALLDFVDRLGGRFALVAWSDAGAVVLHDAIGSRSVYYWSGRFGASSSHAPLLAKAVGAERREDVAQLVADPGFASRRVRYLPGDWTLYEGIHALTPNNLYDTRTRATRRHWPREPLRPCDLASFQAVADTCFRSLAAYVQPRYLPVFGLTGGIDSRTVFAAFRRQGLAFETVTWRNVVASTAGERATIEALAAHLGTTHHDVSSRRTKPLRAARIGAFNGGGHQPPAVLAQAMGRRFQGPPPRAFIRCWGGEILRGF